MSKSRTCWWVLGAIAAWSVMPSSAIAAPQLCSNLPNAVYLEVAQEDEPLMKAMGQKLRASQVNPISIIYKLQGSCSNIDAMYNGIKLTTNPQYVPSSAEDPTWDPSKPAPQCTIDPAGTTLDVVSSAVYVSACTQSAAPAGIGRFPGGIEPYVFVVPEKSTQTAITAEQAYFVFGFGNDDQVTPWNDIDYMFTRPTTKAPTFSVGAGIQVPNNKWQGTPLALPTDVINAVATSKSAEKTIGVLGTADYDPNRGVLNALAFRTFNQKHAYFPDSTSAATDKRNVRDGHYVLWSQSQWIAPVDGSNQIINPRARYVVDLLTDQTTVPTPDFDPLAVVISKGLVPQCAMTVTRSSEGGDLSLAPQSAPCGCFFESQVGSPSPSCLACNDDGPCGSGKCRHGFCEAN